MLQPPWRRILLCLILASAATACPAALAASIDMSWTMSGDLPEAARQAVERAAAAGRQGRHAEAIALLLEARKTAPYAPQVLYGLGAANDKFGGREVPAIGWFRAYLAAAPRAENAAQVRARIAKLDAAAEGHVLEYVRIARQALGTLSEKEKAIELGKHKAELIAATGLMGQLPLAKEIGRQAEEDEDSVMTLLAYAQTEAGATDEALKVARSLVKDPTKKGWIAKAVVFSRVKDGDAPAALAAAELIADDKDRDEALATIAPLQTQYGDAEGAAATLARIKDSALAANASGGIVAAKLKVGNLDRISDSIARAGGSPDACYPKIMQNQMEMGNLDAARQTLSQISDASPVEKVSACMLLAGACRNAGDSKGARDLLQSGIDLLARQPEGPRPGRLWIGNSSLSRFLEAAAKEGLAGALDLAPRFLDPVNECRLYANVAKWQCGERGDTKAAKETLAKVPPPPPGKSEREMQMAYFFVAEAQAMVGNVVAVRQIAEFTTEPFMKERVKCVIGAAQVMAGDVAGALRTADAILAPEMKNTAYVQIAEAQVRTGDVPGALRTADTIADLKSKGNAYAGTVGAQARAGDTEGAFRTAAAMTDPGIQWMAYKNIGIARLVAGDLPNAKEAFAKAVPAIQRTTDVEPYEWTFLASDQIRAGDKEGAHRTLMLGLPILAKRKPPRMNEHGFYSHPCTDLAETGDFAAAVELVGWIAQREDRVAALHAIAAKQRKAGDPEGANRTVAMIPAFVALHTPLYEVMQWISQVESVTAPEKVKPWWNEAPVANLNPNMEHIKASHILDQFRSGSAAANLLARHLYKLRATEARWAKLRANPDGAAAASAK